jgi:hypothetical protein
MLDRLLQPGRARVIREISIALNAAVASETHKRTNEEPEGLPTRARWNV